MRLAQLIQTTPALLLRQRPSGEYEVTASKTGFRITKTLVTATVGLP